MTNQRIKELEEAITRFKTTLTDTEKEIYSYISFPGVYLHKRDEMKRAMSDLSMSRNRFIEEVRKVRAKATAYLVVYEVYSEQNVSLINEDYKIEYT